MKAKKTVSAPGATKSAPSPMGELFEGVNYRWMLIAVAIVALGYILMAGGKSNDPNVFDTNQVYSTVRITIAPIIILAGLVLAVVAIFKQPKRSSEA